MTVKAKPTSISNSAPQPILKWILSLFIILHFGLLSISYFSNWRRSGISDSLLTLAQPYLLTLDLGFEMVPIEWGKAPDRDIPVRIVVYKSKPESKPTVFLDSQAGGPDRLMKRQLLMILQSLIEGYDDESATELLSSIVQHADARELAEFDSIAMELKRDPFSEYEAIYRAAVVREQGAAPRLVPSIEPQRTSKGMKEGKQRDMNKLPLRLQGGDS